jgi:ribonucleoside-diphosphate reductase alpha chain
MRDISNFYSEFIYKRTYSRWIWDQQRRERWEETVDRYFDFFRDKVPTNLQRSFDKAREFVLEKKIMPSMRALWSAGPALENDNIAGYNCAYVVIDRVKALSEIMYILMNGCGAGFSVERQYINNLPEIPAVINKCDETLVFEDSKFGWADGFRRFLEGLYMGKEMDTDFTLIRPKGAILKTFGGRASGPEPLKRLIEFTIQTFHNAKGRKLSSLEVHDLACYTASIVVVGGVRRSASISLSNLSDQRMMKAKEGQFWMSTPYRQLANNSVAYTERPEVTIFMEEWGRLIKSGAGERGIFNREGAKNIAALNGRRDPNWDFGTNPCSEIILRPNQFCNLSEVVVRYSDKLNDLTEKVKFATILGVLQSTLTDFKFLDEDWKKNCDEERLLGVSLTGIMDHPVLSNEKKAEKASDWLESMKTTAINIAEKWSRNLGINMPAAITAIKPSGTVSQLVNTSSGIHPRYSMYYIRRVRVSKTDPICQFLIDKGVNHNPELEQGTVDECSTVVFDFPIKSPTKRATFRNDKTALAQLEHWRVMQIAWCEHKPSITCYVREDEWLEVGAWVYKNWDIVSGISFLPYDTGIYQLPPYEEITEEEYKELVKEFPRNINFEDLNIYESEDYTVGAQELACSAGGCELI